MFGWKKGKGKEVPAVKQTVVIRNRFTEAVNRVKHLEYYEPSASVEAPHGYFDGRPIIGAKTSINGGVFIGAGPHEAIVVDESYGELEKVYSALTVEFARNEQRRELLSERIFPYLVEVVQRTLEFRPEAVRELERAGRLEADRKVALDFFIRNGFGAARHQVLLAAYLLEKLTRRGLLEGSFSIDERILSDYENGERLEYISHEGSRFIFNPLEPRRTFTHHIPQLQPSAELRTL